MKRKLVVVVKDEGEDEEELRKCSGFWYSGSRRKSKFYWVFYSYVIFYIYFFF